jgi:hypothetical protein
MKQFASLLLTLTVSCIISAQGFPDAQKQPKFKEQKPNQHKFKKWSHRRHVKRGTVYIQPAGSINLQTPVCILTESKPVKNIA